MLDLDWDEESVAIFEVAKQIGAEVLSPVARDAERAGHPPTRAWTTILESGLLHAIPESRGGAGESSAVAHLLAVEGLAYGDAGITLGAAWSGAVAYLIAHHCRAGHDALLDRLINDPGARAGVALYEGYGRGVDEIDTVVEVRGDSVSVRGSKIAVAFAEQALATVVVGKDSASGLLRAVLVPGDTAGIVVKPSSQSLGLDSAGLSSVSYNVTVGADHVLGGVDGDSSALLPSLARIRLLLAATAVGVAQRAIDYASEYALERIAFQKPIAANQGVSFPLAEAQMRTAASRQTILDLASRLDAEPFASIDDAVTDAVNYACNAACESTRSALQTLGGHGYILDHPVEIWYRCAAAIAAIDFDVNRSAFHPAV